MTKVSKVLEPGAYTTVGGVRAAAAGSANQVGLSCTASAYASFFTSTGSVAANANVNWNLCTCCFAASNALVYVSPSSSRL